MFLTLEDPRARVKGSRDPLGVQPIWSAFGRHIVANLTTVTDSLRGFTVLLLGRYLGERLLREGKISEEDVVDVFLRTEQVCGYVRCLALGDDAGSEGRILGIERVRRRISEGGSTVKIGTTPDATILSDQKTYGLWGLFSVSARVSKLLREGPVGVTCKARDFIEGQYMPRLSPVLKRLETLVMSGGTLAVKPHDPIVSALRGILGGELSAAERKFYRAYLCDAQYCDHMKSGRQATLWRLLEKRTSLRSSINRAELVSIMRSARRIDAELARRIGRILALETLLAPCDAIFGFLQTRHGQVPARIAESLRERWGERIPHLDAAEFAEIRDEIASLVGTEVTARMAETHGGLSHGNYQVAIEGLLEWNRLVMTGRRAAPWVRLDDRGALDVRYRGIERELPAAEGMSSLWRNSYFIDSLKALVAQTAAVAPRHAS